MRFLRVYQSDQMREPNILSTGPSPVWWIRLLLKAIYCTFYLSIDPLNASDLQLTNLVLVDCLRNHWPFWSVLHPYQFWVLASKRRVYARSSETWARRRGQSCTALQLCIPRHLGILLNPENKVDINSQYGLILIRLKQLTLLKRKDQIIADACQRYSLFCAVSIKVCLHVLTAIDWYYQSMNYEVIADDNYIIL